MYTCVICGFPELDEPPFSRGKGSFEICPSCGFQFGYDDAAKTEKYRAEWKNNGCKWWSQSPPPKDWNPFEQLKNIERQ